MAVLRATAWTLNDNCPGDQGTDSGQIPGKEPGTAGSYDSFVYGAGRCTHHTGEQLNQAVQRPRGRTADSAPIPAVLDPGDGQRTATRKEPGKKGVDKCIHLWYT